VSNGTAAVINPAVKAAVRSSFIDFPLLTPTTALVTATQNEQFKTRLDQRNGPSGCRSHPPRSAAPLVGRLSVRHQQRFLVWQVFQFLRKPCPETRTNLFLPTT
jgi:hypothetical protein